MDRTRFNPALSKKCIVTFRGYDVSAVNAFAIGSIAQLDAACDRFSTHNEFPDLKPRRERKSRCKNYHTSARTDAASKVLP